MEDKKIDNTDYASEAEYNKSDNKNKKSISEDAKKKRGENMKKAREARMKKLEEKKKDALEHAELKKAEIENVPISYHEAVKYIDDEHSDNSPPRIKKKKEKQTSNEFNYIIYEKLNRLEKQVSKMYTLKKAKKYEANTTKKQSDEPKHINSVNLEVGPAVGSSFIKETPKIMSKSDLVVELLKAGRY